MFKREKKVSVFEYNNIVDRYNTLLINSKNVIKDYEFMSKHEITYETLCKEYYDFCKELIDIFEDKTTLEYKMGKMEYVIQKAYDNVKIPYGKINIHCVYKFNNPYYDFAKIVNWLTNNPNVDYIRKCKEICKKNW
jgi:hypothetical protein